MSFIGYLLAHHDPARLAVIDEQGTSHDYGALASGITNTAAWLRARSVGVGDRVVLIADNSFFWLTSYLGTIAAGCVVVPLVAQSTPHEVARAIGLVRATAAIVSRKRASGVGRALDGVAALLEGDTYAAGATVDASFIDRAPHDLAALMFTSGSTGEPRAVMVSHGNLIANTSSIIEALGITSNDRMMVVLPFSYCYGASVVHTHLRAGASLVIDNRFMFADKVLARINTTECTGFAGVPSHYQILLRKSRMRSMQFPSLRTLQQAGGRLAPATLTELKATVAPAKVFVMYGQTEATARLSCLHPDAPEAKIGSVGRAIPGVTLGVCNEHGEAVAVGEVGELVARGENVTLGYWGDAEASRGKLHDGVLKTGDLARMDNEGYVTIVDRLGDFLKCAGVRTSVRVVEDILFEHGDVVEAAVLGVPHEMQGEAPMAFVVLRPGHAADASARILEQCAARLPAELVPVAIHALDSLPKTANGKVSRIALRASLEASNRRGEQTA